MKTIILLSLIIYTRAQNGSNASNITGNGNETTTTTTVQPTTTTLRGITTTVGPTTTVEPTTRNPTTTTAPTSVGPQTTTLRPQINTTTPPLCSADTMNTSCRVCLGPLCKFVERGDQGVGWEILFVAFAIGLVGVIWLSLWYVCLRPILLQNRAEDILWLTDSSDDEDWQETATMLSRHDIKRKTSREFEIVDLNPVKSDK